MTALRGQRLLFDPENYQVNYLLYDGTPPHVGGDTSTDGAYVHDRDHDRLASATKKVHAFMLDGQWHEIEEVSLATGYPLGSALTSRIRDMRKRRFGGHTVECEFVRRGVHRYRVLIPVEERQLALV